MPKSVFARGTSFYNTRWLLCILIAGYVCSSCKPLKNVTYFTTLPKDTAVTRYVADFPATRISIGDKLSVRVSSFNNDLDLVFNNTEKANSGMTAPTQQQTAGILVDQEGNVQLHFIGKQKAAGFTLSELKANLERELSKYMKDPIIQVGFANRKVTVIGDVVTPKIVFFEEEQVPLVDVIAQCGDLNDGAIANDVVVYRDSADQKLVKHINLEDHSIFASKWYYARPNDIIYIKKDIDQTDREEKKRSLQLTLSLFVSFATLVVIIINNLIK